MNWKHRVGIMAAIAASAGAPAIAQTVVGFASLPAATFEPGPTSGQFIAPANGVPTPFVNQQPLQGISSVLRTSNGEYLVMSDNGFGAQNNSADYVLRVHRIDPDFRTAQGGSGTVAVRSFIELSDPDDLIPFPIVAESATYPGSSIAVDARIRSQRLLTGGDFDIESVREAHDGTLWFGDEFGPFLLHTDADGRLLEAPIPLAGVKSPQNPTLGGGAPTLPGSKGFEGMAISPNGRTLYPMLEGALIADPDRRHLIINEFDVKTSSYTGRQWHYHLEAPAYAIGDLTAVNKDLFLLIERDNNQGAAARFKRIYLVNFKEVGGDGFLVKHEVADLMNLSDPLRLGGQDDPFTFPFQTIESVIPFNEREIGVLDDNNFPFSNGRVPGQPDPNEFVIIRLPQPLVKYAGQR